MKYNIDVLSRGIAAIFGGYAVSVAFSFALVPILIWCQVCPQNEAVMVATMLSYVVYFTVIILSFSRQTASLLWRDIILSLCLLVAIYCEMGAL